MPAVPLHAGAVVDDVRMALGVRQGRFLARVDHLHRPLGGLGQQRQVDLDGDVLFAAEAAADHGALDANLALRDADRAGDAAEVLDHLGGDANVEHAALIRPRHPGFRLNERVLLIRHPEGVLDDQVRLGEARVHVPLADRPARHHVPQAGIGRVGQVLDGRARLQRLQRIEDARQDLVLDLDELERPLRDVQRLGGHQRDRLAVEAHLIRGQHRHIRAAALLLAGLARHVGHQLDVGQVRRGEDAGDARQVARLAHVQPHDPRARLRAAEDLGVEHQRQREVARVHRGAHGLAHRIHAAQWLADLPQLGEGVRGEGFDRLLANHWAPPGTNDE